MDQFLPILRHNLQKLSSSVRSDADSLSIAVHSCLEKERFVLVGVDEEAVEAGQVNALTGKVDGGAFVLPSRFSVETNSFPTL